MLSTSVCCLNLLGGLVSSTISLGESSLQITLIFEPVSKFAFGGLNLGVSRRSPYAHSHPASVRQDELEVRTFSNSPITPRTDTVEYTESLIMLAANLLHISLYRVSWGFSSPAGSRTLGSVGLMASCASCVVLDPFSCSASESGLR